MLRLRHILHPIRSAKSLYRKASTQIREAQSNLEEISRLQRIQNIPDREFYKPLFSPWEGFGDFARIYSLVQPYTLVSKDRCYVLYTLARQALFLEGEIWECGVYTGGTARLFSTVIAEEAKHDETLLRLFDTFEGMPETDPLVDIHKEGDFSGTSLESVAQIVGHPHIVRVHKGRIPDTFGSQVNAKIALAHIDVDIYQSVIDCCTFIYPRLVLGGFMVFDDYGFPTCPGARKAVDEFFSQKPEKPLVLPTGQAIIFPSGNTRLLKG